MSAIDNYEIPHSNNSTTSTKKPKKLIHFSDGSTMEVEDEIDNTKFAEEPLENQKHDEQDPKSLSWPEWLKYYSHKGASSVVGGMEYSGETLAYYLGITSPKYQQEIDEYNRMVTKKMAHESEAKSWASTDPTSPHIPIVMEQISSEKVAGSSKSKGVGGLDDHKV